MLTSVQLFLQLCFVIISTLIVKDLESIMQNSDELGKENSTQKDIQTSEETLKVRLNGDHILMVSKEKLLEKSHYFKSITKSCFSDYKSEFTEVSIPVRIDIFKQVIDYVSTDVINFEKDNIFEIFQISDYLQIECLRKMCLDHFIYNLNRKTVDRQLSLMENNQLFCKDLKELALKFKESGSPSFSGFYMIERSGDKNSLKLIVNDGSEHVINFQYNFQGILLHYFSNSIIIQTFDMYPYFLNLVTGKFFDIEVKLSWSIICSDNKNLYVVTPIEDDKHMFDLSVLGNQIGDEVLKVCKEKKFTFSDPKQAKKYKFYYLFSICDEGKLYLFYRQTNKSSYVDILDCLQHIHMLTISIETLTIVGNKMLTESLRFGTGGDLTQKESIRLLKTRGMFSKLFFLKKSHKLFIKIRSYDDVVLVFDVKSQYFYFAEDVIPNTTKHNRYFKYFTVDKNDVVYGLRYNMIRLSRTKEIRAFHCMNDKLVDAGIKLTFSNKNSLVMSICIV